jgi:D-alanine-D-alanine ligase-like ATP-grasp enzyme
VDAIVDGEERIWTLEMNSNPAIHPYAYPVMLDSLFAARKEAIPGEALAG